MSRLIEALPGLALPVAEVTSTLSRIWEGEPGVDGPGGDYRASQLNLVLHFGLRTDPAEALAQFETAIRFGQRYPCRIIVLCPEEKAGGGMEAKLFTQCYIGQSLRRMCCCEALILGYPLPDNTFLGNQLSVWLEPDLPVYYWFHRVPSQTVSDRYLGFTRTCRRVLYDSDVDGYSFHRLAWPRPADLRDLAWARTLPIRQALGQFLSSYPPEQLVQDCRRLQVIHDPQSRGEAENLVCWIYGCLHQCLRRPGSSRREIPWEIIPDPTLSELGKILLIRWGDPARSFLHCRLDRTRSTGEIEACFGGGTVQHRFQIREMDPAETLAEAVFFDGPTGEDR